MTVATFAPRVRALCPPKSRDTYGAGFDRLVDQFGPTALEAVQTVELAELRDRIRRDVGEARVRSAELRGRQLRSYDPDAHGHGAAENFVRSTRFFFRTAVRVGLLRASPAADLAAPDRPPAPERPLTESELAELRRIAGTTGQDPLLDVLLLDFLRQTAARREGALNLRRAHLHHGQRAVTLTEKRGSTRTLPLGTALLARLDTLSRERGGRLPQDHVFRFRDGTPLTRRRFNSLFDRLDRHSEWSEQLDVGAHWLRHTTLSDVAAVSGLRVAQDYAGHRPRRSNTIERYTAVDFEDLVAAYECLFGPQ
ncbi:Site-specific recombinase XerC [Geodermatophilus amargosae]|uniref:Site-specific recombinase XerC n=1 Tax=Geodermatophilus amargosae TaxID=1296565 RepID=A0A1I7D8D0_9ACTN|nr:tyrosine-type recombinase/integrase [Geodermatophilus amargosae]SFU08003.1 Site-specific recombinase XerC [Geodermatophilus amargosae]